MPEAMRFSAMPAVPLTSVSDNLLDPAVRPRNSLNSCLVIWAPWKFFVESDLRWDSLQNPGRSW